ncbi:MAG: hypothetical protein WAU02_01565 [Candidatus Saccharimonadales bacterium]
MNPPLSTHIAMIETSVWPLVEDLASIRSCNGAVVFMRDGFHRDDAVALSSVEAAVAEDRLEFVRSAIEGHRVDLNASTLGTTFTTHISKIEKSRMNTDHLTWGGYIDLPNDHEAVVQLAFVKNRALPTPTQLDKIWSKHRSEIAHSLIALTTYDTVSIADEHRTLVPVTPNAFVIKWDLANSSQTVATAYGDFRHFITTFEYALSALVPYHGGTIASFTGDGQNIVIRLPGDIDPNDQHAIATFGHDTVLPLIDKIQRAHESLAAHYPVIMRLNLALGLGHIETSQHGEVTGPIFWKLSSKLKSLSVSGDMINIVLEDAARSVLET